MKNPGKTHVLLICALLLNACSIDEGVGPERHVDAPPATEGFSAFSLSPGDATIDIDAELQLTPIAKNARGLAVIVPNVLYTIDAPDVLTVSGSGRVRGLAPGTAHVTARATVGSATHVSSIAITVRMPPISEGVIISAQPSGWQPQVAHITAGSVVQWRGGLIAVSGLGVHTVYVTTNPDWTDYETFPLDNGFAARTFNSPGTYYFCSNACWDPPEYGTIIVH